MFNLFKILGNTKKGNIRNVEFSIQLVKLSSKISSTTSKPQLIKIGEKYYRIRELG